jgi:hypothetical protein
MFNRSWRLADGILALMSGPLSIFRECMGLFFPGRVPGPELFWTCARIAFIVSITLLWIDEYRGRQKQKDSFNRRFRDLELRLADRGPRIKLEWDRSAPMDSLGLSCRLLLDADADVSEARIRPILGNGFSLAFTPLHVIEAARARAISAQLNMKHEACAGTARCVYEEYFKLTGASLPLVIDYRDMRGNSFIVAWYMERREIEDMQGSRVNYPLRQDPDSYRYIPPTP